MFDELLWKVNQDGFVVHEMVPDKDTSINVTFCSHTPEGTVAYCPNHCTKTLHQKIKRNKCEVCV